METFKTQKRKATTPDWHAHQNLFLKTRARNAFVKKILRLALIAAIFLIVLYSLVQCYHWIAHNGDPSIEKTSVETDAVKNQIHDKQTARKLISGITFFNLEKNAFQANQSGQILHFDTSIDPSLQSYMLKKLDRKNSRHIALVAMDPDNGEIIMMAGFNKLNPDDNTCLEASYPAASIFKIITAAAVVETENFDANKKLRYNGSQHTLYKVQLKDRNNRYTNHTTLQEAFAKSINPVFGKLGALNLEKDQLAQYAHTFGFNRDINFELPIPHSSFEITEKSYHWAEIASGFNRQTTLSAVHAALLPAVILNQGRQVEPSIVQRIEDQSGKLLYQSRPGTKTQVISPKASRVVYDLMEATIRYGTARKAFKGFQKDPVLAKCNLGGKTGSIFNKKHDLRYDWFVGFADLKNGHKKLALAVVVAHEEYIGIRASAYARMVFKKFYSDFFKTG